MSAQGGVHPGGGVCPGGGVSAQAGGVCPGGSGRHPPVDRMTDARENITLPQLLLQAVKKKQKNCDASLDLHRLLAHTHTHSRVSSTALVYICLTSVTRAKLKDKNEICRSISTRAVKCDGVFFVLQHSFQYGFQHA